MCIRSKYCKKKEKTNTLNKLSKLSYNNISLYRYIIVSKYILYNYITLSYIFYYFIGYINFYYYSSFILLLIKFNKTMKIFKNSF